MDDPNTQQPTPPPAQTPGDGQQQPQPETPPAAPVEEPSAPAEGGDGQTGADGGTTPPPTGM